MQDPLNGRVVHPGSKNKDKGKKFQQIIVTYSQRGRKRRRGGWNELEWNSAADMAGDHLTGGRGSLRYIRYTIGDRRLTIVVKVVNYDDDDVIDVGVGRDCGGRGLVQVLMA